MKLKSLALLVCLVLMVFGFTTAVAGGVETVTTVTCKPGSMLADNETLNQICEAAAIRVHSMPEGYGSFVLSLNGQDALNSLFRFEEEGVYVQSQMFGSAPLYFNWEDLTKLLKEQMENNSQMQTTNPMFSGDMFQAMLDGTMTEEQSLEMMGIDDEMLAFISDVEASRTVETGAFVLEGSDVANQKAETVLTKEDLIRAIELPMVRKQLTSQLMMTSPELSEAEVNREVDAQLNDIKQVVEENNLSVTVASYTNDDAFVGFSFVVSGLVSDVDDAAAEGNISLTVTKTTVDQAEFYQMALKLVNADEEYLNQYGSLYLADGFASGSYVLNSMDSGPILTADFNCDTTQANHTTGEISATLYEGYSNDKNSALVVFDQQKTENTTDTAIDVFTGSVNVDMLKNQLSESDLISFYIHTVTQPDSGYFSDLQNATPENTVQLLQMTGDELDAYMQSMEQGFMMTLFTIIDNLPPDISNSLMQEMGTL